MKALEELINTDEPAWPLLAERLALTSVKVRVLPADVRQRAQTLHRLQITTRSTLGAVAYETGGLLVDEGWLRVLGTGCPELPVDLATWNGVDSAPRLSGGFVVAFDVIGGFFALDGGRFGSGDGAVWYFAPDSLKWERTHDGYSDLLWWLLDGRLAQFAESFRWTGWEEDVRDIPGDAAFSLYPPPFTVEGGDPEMVSRGRVPIDELWEFYGAQEAETT